MFANPLMLGGLAAGAAPIIIHLLSRQRYRRIVWAAMHWLLEAYRKSSRRLRIEQLILLAIRVLILMLLALAFARPQFTEGASLFGGARRLHRVIVLDTSASMGWREARRPALFARAKEVAGRLRANMGPGDALSLIGAAHAPRVILKGHTQPRSEEVAACLASIELTDGATDMVAALGEAWGLATDDEVSRNPRREVFILTDGTRNAWVDPNTGVVRRPDLVEEIRKAAKDESGAAVPVVYVVDMAAPTPGRPPTSSGDAWPERLEWNVALEELQPETPFIVAGAAVTLNARVRDWGHPQGGGATEAEGVPVTLWVDGEKQATKRSALIERLGGEAAVSFSHVFEEPGPHRVRVTCPLDCLAADNARYLAVEVQERVRVLLVDGDPRPGPLQSETDPLFFLFAPRGAGDEKSAEFPIRPEVVPEGDWYSRFGGPGDGPQWELGSNGEPGKEETGRRDAGDGGRTYDLVVLANVAGVPEEHVAALEAYVAGGGGLLIYMGDRVDTALYNRYLFKDGKGLLPAALTAPVGERAGRELGAVHFEPESYDHPVLRLFRDPRHRNVLPRARVWRYMGTQVDAADPRVRTVLRYSDGAAAILERSFAPQSPGIGATRGVGDRGDKDRPPAPGSRPPIHGGQGGGRVCLVTTTADDDWTDFSWRTGVLMTYDLFYHLMRRPGSGLNLTVGDPIQDRLRGTEFGRSITIFTPPRGAGQPSSAEGSPVEGRQTLQAKEEEGRPTITFEDTDHAGFYRLEIGRATGPSAGGAGAPGETRSLRRRFFAENLDPVESDLARLVRTADSDELEKLLPEIPLHRVAPSERHIEEALGLQSSRREFWRSFVWAVLALLCLESFLAWFWGRGR